MGMGMQSSGAAGPPGSQPQSPIGPPQGGGVNEYSPLSRGFMQNTLGGSVVPQGTQIPPQQQMQQMRQPPQGGGAGGAAGLNPFYKPPSGGGMMGGFGGASGSGAGPMKALAGK